MLGPILLFLKKVLIPIIYLGGIFTMFASIFRKAEWGLFLMVAMIPLPNLYYKFYDYPFGKDFLDLLFFAILLGIFINKKGFSQTNNSTVIILFLITSYIAIWNSSMRFSLPAPVSTKNQFFVQWKNYAMMIFMYFLVFNTLKSEKQQKILLIIMALTILFISFRSYRSFTPGASFVDDSRATGPFWRVGLGSNHFGAFIVDYCSVFLGLALFDKDKWRKLLFGGVVLLSLHPLFFSYSRGAYLAALSVMVFLGLFKKKSLLILSFILLLSWHTLLPSSVVERIEMTKTESGELERSASLRLNLWDHAMNLFKQNPIFGVGFGGFAYTVPEGMHLRDTHNFYLKILSEQGIIGLFLLLLIFYKAFKSGWRLFKMSKEPFYKGLGFGFLGCIIAFIVTNMFGERFSYFVLGSYFWALWGLVDRGILLSHTESV